MRTIQIQRFLKQILSLALVLFCCMQVWSQAPFYRVGDVYTNTDGSKGIVFYITRDGGGWMVDLKDKQNASWGAPMEILTPITSTDQFGSQWNGYANTDTLRTLLLSSVANTVEFDNGWYLPSAEQLSILFASLSRIYTAFTPNGGTAPRLKYWSSTPYNADSAWVMDFSNGKRSVDYKNRYYAVRAIRNFTCEYTYEQTYSSDSSLTYEWSTGETTLSIEVYPNTTTMYYVIAKNNEGDTAMAFFNLEVNPVYEDTVEVVTCDSFMWHRHIYTQSGEYIYHGHTMEAGCDSIIHLFLTINNSKTVYIEKDTCCSYQWNDQVYDSSGVYVQHLFTKPGCDSTVYLDLTIRPNYFEDTLVHICSSQLPYLWRDTLFGVGTVSQTDTFFRHSVHGCDSIVVLRLHVFSGDTTDQTVSACDSYTINETTLFDSGDYLIQFDIGAVCDSVVRLHLTISPEQHDTTIITGCDEYYWRGNVYTETGEYESFETNQSGCDSVHHLKLIINHNGIKDYYGEVCKGEDYIDTENDFMVSRTDTMALGCNDIRFYRGQSASGCDSIHILHLSVYGREVNIQSSQDTICTNETDSVTLEVVGDNYTDIPTSCSIPEIAIGYILCTDGSIVKPNLDSLNGHTAKGVIFHVDASGMHGWAVALQDLSSTNWSSPGVLADTSHTYSTVRGALRDTSGYAHTQAMLNIRSQSYYPVLGGLDINEGWYLPAAGQLRELSANINIVNNSLRGIGLTEIEITEDFYWSSSERNRTRAIMVNRDGEINISDGNKNSGNAKRRFVCSF